MRTSGTVRSSGRMRALNASVLIERFSARVRVTVPSPTSSPEPEPGPTWVNTRSTEGWAAIMRSTWSAARLICARVAPGGPSMLR